jgi:hypothetical protein
MFILHSSSARRSIAALGAAGAIAAAISGCSTPAAAVPPAKTTVPVSASASAQTSTTTPVTPTATASTAVAQASSAPTSAASPSMPAGSTGCATAAGALKDSSITVCPDAAPVGAVVHVIVINCDTVDPAAGLPELPAAGLFFLGPNSWLGTDGGGGANVPYEPRTDATKATATFTIPATYTGGNENGGAYPTLRTTPGSSYAFVTDPAGACNVHFTVTGS